MVREKKPLPLARASGVANRPLPDAETFKNAMCVATTEEAATYLYHSAMELFTKVKMLGHEAIQKMAGVLRENAHNIELLTKDDGASWTGKQPAIGFKKFQNELASEAAKLIGEYAAEGIDLDFAVSNNSELIRGHSSNGKEIDPGTVDAMDNLFNAWLAENHMINRGGVIYEAMTERGREGEIKMGPDEQGNPVGVRADAERLRQMVMDKDNGFEHYVHQHKKSMLITVYQQPYPEPQAAAGFEDEVGPSSGGAGR